MQHATRKLKSTRGASLIFALLVFMLCIFAGVAALTAAAANIGRYTHLEYEQQQYLSVASALELLQSQLDAEAKTPAATTVTVTYTETKTWWYCPDGAGIPQRYDDQAYTLNVTDKDGNVLDPDTLGFYQVQLLEQFVPQAWRENVDSTTYSTARPDAGGGGNLAPWPTWSASTTFADKKYEIAIKNNRMGPRDPFAGHGDGQAR